MEGYDRTGDIGAQVFAAGMYGTTPQGLMDGPDGIVTVDET